jgi:hypothetical protein
MTRCQVARHSMAAVIALGERCPSLPRWPWKGTRPTVVDKVLGRVASEAKTKKKSPSGSRSLLLYPSCTFTFRLASEATRSGIDLSVRQMRGRGVGGRSRLVVRASHSHPLSILIPFFLLFWEWQCSPSYIISVEKMKGPISRVRGHGGITRVSRTTVHRLGSHAGTRM